MVVAYVRVSTDKQHPENQENEIRRFASANGWEIDKWVMEKPCARDPRSPVPLTLAVQNSLTL